MSKRFDNHSRPSRPTARTWPALGGTPGPAERQLALRLALWIYQNAQLGESWAGNTGPHSEFQLRERIKALRKAVEAQKHAMKELHVKPGTATFEEELIDSGMQVRLNEALRIEHFLQTRAKQRLTSTEPDDDGGAFAKLVDAPALRETTLCLLSTEALLQRLSDLRMVVTAYNSAQTEARRHTEGTDPQGDNNMRALVKTYREQAHAVAAILRNRGVDMRKR